MPFKGLEDRFIARANELYNRGSTTDGSNGQPYLEFKPNTPRRSDTTNDTFTLPVASTKRDLKRIGKFLKSGDGIRFLAKQELQQLGNKFSETRIINPLFAIENVLPFVHTMHPLVGTNDFAVRDADDTVSPASNDIKIGGSGRMQKSTAAEAIQNVAGTGGLTGLLSLLPASRLVQEIMGVVALANAGSTGMDGRPELNLNGSYYSIAMWNRFQKQRSPQDYFSTAKKNLRVGNITGAYDALKGAVNSVIGTIKGVTGQITHPTTVGTPAGRQSPDTKGIEGSRYFITGKLTADRYIRNSIAADGEPDVGYLDRRPYRVEGTAPTLFDTLGAPTSTQTFTNSKGLSSFLSPFTAAQNATQNAVNRAEQNRRNIEQKAKDAERSARSVATVVQNVVQNPNLFSLIDAVRTAGQLATGGNVGVLGENPSAGSAMLFPQTSLQSRYDTQGASDVIRNELDAQKDSAFAYWKKALPFANIGFKGGILPGKEHDLPGSARVGSVGYYKDPFNTVSGVSEKTDLKTLGNDLINVSFLDYNNKVIIPFRAFVSNISEQVIPEYSDHRYIGRTERNVIYVGAQRDLSFRLDVQAFSEQELENIWLKVSGLTGLCFPAQYDGGYMIPPFVKLTIGDVFKGQPGYIKGLTHTIDDNASWEISNGSQAPHGVSINVQFSIIESISRTSKTSLGSGRFYNVTAPTTK
jgi:hypothetical protein